MRTVGLSVAAMGAIPLLGGGAGRAEAANGKVTDADILNFALNLE
jgi:hypothetical protein